MAVEAVEKSRKQADGRVVLHPRRRFELPAGGGFFHYMAQWTRKPVHRHEAVTYVKGVLRFLFRCMKFPPAALLAMIEADSWTAAHRRRFRGGHEILPGERPNRSHPWNRGQAKPNSKHRRYTQAGFGRVYGRDPERRANFCAEMTARLDSLFIPLRSAAEAVQGADIVNTATTSAKPSSTAATSLKARISMPSVPTMPQARTFDDTALSSRPDIL